MSLDTVVEEIREEAEAEAESIREAAREDAEQIRETAREDADRIREEAEAEVDAEIDQQRRQQVSAAKLEAKQTRLEARRDALEDVRERLEETVGGLRGERRERLTEALFTAAAAEFDDGERLRLYGHSDDQDLLESVLADSEHDGEVAGEYDCLGGVVVEGESSRVRVNNTFDSVLEEVWEDQLREVSERLFADADVDPDADLDVEAGGEDTER